MDALRHRLLARTVGTEHHYGHLRWGDQSGVFLHLQDLGACPVEKFLFLLPYDNHRSEYILCQFQQMFFAYRLGQVVYRT